MGEATRIPDLSPAGDPSCATPLNTPTEVDNSYLRQLGDRTVLVADPSMRQLYESVERIARTSMPVLICGETGTGKEVIAEAIHLFGPRALKPLVRINCAALAPTLVESQLFGHEKGAFTGASNAQPGLLEEAAGGSVFLDEISELPLPAQSKLLRVVESSHNRRLGAGNERYLDLRVLAATNRDLHSMIKAGAFREDLYYRLATFVVNIPPLRDRRVEIPLFAYHFAGQLCRGLGRQSASFDPGFIPALTNYDWPGNVRELRSIISRSLVLCDTVINCDHLSQVMPSHHVGKAEPSAISAPFRDQVHDFERRRIVDALRDCNWNQTRAAEALRMPRRTLVWKIAALRGELPDRMTKRNSCGRDNA